MTYTEDELIEQPTINLFSNIGWQTIDCFSEVFGEEGTLARDNRSEVILIRELREALLNDCNAESRHFIEAIYPTTNSDNVIHLKDYQNDG
ncbi:MAG: hypothetical protein KAT06_04570 [Gammaproteobacteria bacterium]|nr:hypothetical protein [Gammaproteobacteria bacterium]